MAFPPAGERTQPAKKGKSKSRRYHMVWCYREEDSNDMDLMNHQEAKSTNINSATTSLLKILNEGVDRTDPDFLKKSDIVVVQARVLERGENLPEAEDED